MKSREERRWEARSMSGWVLVAVTGLLLMYVLVTGTPTWVAAMTPLIAATAALSGVYLGSRLNQRQQEQEDERKRRILATLLLQELQLLEIVLKDIHDSFEKEWEGVESFHTATYDQAGPELLRLRSDTVDQLASFYQLVHTLQMELNRFRHHPPGSRTIQDGILKVRATQTAHRIRDVARLLVAEGGIWPGPSPTIMVRTFPPEGPRFQPLRLRSVPLEDRRAHRQRARPSTYWREAATRPNRRV